MTKPVKKIVGFVLAIVFLVAAIVSACWTADFVYWVIYFAHLTAEGSQTAYLIVAYAIPMVIAISCLVAFWILFGQFRKYNKYLKG